MSARVRVPAAHPREERPAVPAERASLSAAASRQAGKLPPPEREGKEAAREERNALASSTGARGEPLPAPVLGHSVPQAAVPVKPLALHLAHKARGPGVPFGWEPPPPLPRDPPAEDAREDEAAAAGSEEKLPPPPPPPLPRKENPWTKKPPQHLSPAGTGPPPLPPLEALEAEPSSPQIIKAGKLKTKKSNKPSGFSDMVNWPTPSELVNTECQSVISLGNKKPQNRKEREDKVEKTSNSESKESRETKLDGPGENVSEDEAQSSNQRKKANKHKWVPLHLDDVRSDSQERPGSRNSSRCQPEANKTSHNRRNDTRSWRREREKRDDQDEVSNVRSECGNIRGTFRGRGRGQGRGRGRGRGNPPLNFDYSYGYQEHGERTGQPFQTELNTSMMYYYDDGTGVQVYPVEEALLKEYIKRQIEYYFSIENLERDFFLRRKMDEQGFLPISLIAGFHRVQALTTNLNLILEALKDSTEVEIVDEKMRKKIEPEKWPIPGPSPHSVPQTDFSQLIDCPEFVPGQAFGSHTESAPNSPRIGGPLSPKKNTETSNLQAMSRGLSASLPDLDSEPWIEVRKRHHPSPVKLKPCCAACGILVPRPGIEPVPPALGA
ncbi:la-related protein 1B isoform X2 [Mesoplodon densirostris]|uniref:la-related protein 1B isoform X2 n=1 Tax=Mesoplodon densirostris TaxID=48708 RepID=UPI0028DD09C2|nr:la-related protein 1B isoform X2 [Mesoplodon densirostris]